MATKFRTVRQPLIIGFLLNMGGHIGYATIKPGDNITSLVTIAIEGFGWGMLFGQIIAAVQLSSPHSHIASASALAIVCRALGGVVFTAVYAAVVTNKMNSLIPSYLTKAARDAGVSPALIPEYVADLAAGNSTGLPSGISQEAIVDGLFALKRATADSIRVTAIMAAVFGAVGCVLCYFMGDLKSLMNYHVDAPVEELHAKGAKRHEVGAA